MIPETLNSDNLIDIDEFESPPSLTYRLDFTNRRIIGKVDDKEAVMQFIKKVLDTSKYAYSSYDWYYGNEILSLIGQSYDYIITELPRIVDETLLVDDRIISIQNWNYSRINVDSMSASFLVRTIFGTINYEMEVSI